MAHPYNYQILFKCVQELLGLGIGKKISKFFLSSRDTIMSKIIEAEANTDSNYIFIWYTNVSNLSWKCQTVVEIMNGKWMITE